MHSKMCSWKDLPLESFVIHRQAQSGIEEDEFHQSLTIRVQDHQSKSKKLKLKITITDSEMKLNRQGVEVSAYSLWNEELKRTQRPIWVDPKI